LANNYISDISALAGLMNLELLSLSDNEISDISPLAYLTNLEYLYITLLHGGINTRITDWSPVAHVGSVGGRP